MSTLWHYMREMSKGSSVGTQIRFWSIAVVLSPIILAIYLGLWAEGYLEKNDD